MDIKKLELTGRERLKPGATQRRLVSSRKRLHSLAAESDHLDEKTGS
ncbi:rCG57910 [Rattus norvegicus]|uniref:RCG57910 n=1 Tax=Rattus norvegicus TaxID=10116 RepID=A6J4U7_RAT|nr:rCG57910 [Rattus norvegicus]